MEAGTIAGAVIGGVLGFLLLAFVQIPLTNFGPQWSIRAWTKIIRFFKKGDAKPWTWSTIEEGVLYVSSLPSTPEDLEQMREAPHNLGALVSLNERWELVMGENELDALDIKWHHLPVPDYSAPSLSKIKEGVRFIASQVKLGKGVLVHCNAGRGRSVVVAMAYMLVRHRKDGWDRYKVFEVMRAKRKVANLRAFGDTRPQWRALVKFERFLKEKGDDEAWLQWTEHEVARGDVEGTQEALPEDPLEEIQGDAVVGMGNCVVAVPQDHTHVLEVSQQQRRRSSVEAPPDAAGVPPPGYSRPPDAAAPPTLYPSLDGDQGGGGGGVAAPMEVEGSVAPGGGGTHAELPGTPMRSASAS